MSMNHSQYSAMVYMVLVLCLLYMAHQMIWKQDKTNDLWNFPILREVDMQHTLSTKKDGGHVPYKFNQWLLDSMHRYYSCISRAGYNSGFLRFVTGAAEKSVFFVL